ncbi:hypothetical protein LCGC14_2751330 [marine sediment metagenome]|uniref:Uncharacterized protein n=1 Tax=marine sediment metagenome TaxID=412755 RepID=A0A0F8ZNQ1_9ZZZZ
MTKHTPGPWKEDGSQLVQVVIDNLLYPVAAVSAPGASQEQYLGVLAANARLIAESPTLLACAAKVLEALDSYLDHHGKGLDGVYWGEEADALRTTIAKAEPK